MVYYAIEPPKPWANIEGRPYITVSAKGIANGLSDIFNDGADFGPDTPGTQTSGIQEALNYAQLDLLTYFPPQFSAPVRPIYYNVKPVKLLPGLFKIYAPIVLSFFGEYDGYATFLPNILEGSGVLATFIEDATSTGLSSMITINSLNGTFIPNQEVSQENFNYLGKFSLIANNNLTQYGLNINIGDDPLDAIIEYINFIGNFSGRALWYNACEAFIHYLSFFNTNNTINATLYTPGGVAYADHLYSSGYNYLNLEVGGSQIYISDSLINSLKIGTQDTNNPAGSTFGAGDVFLNNIWFGNNSGIGYLIGIFNNLRTLRIFNAHMKAFATSTTASNSPPVFYLGYTPSSSPAFSGLIINSTALNAYQAVAGATTSLSRDLSGNEFLRSQFGIINAFTEASGYAISTSEFLSINGKWIPNVTTPSVPASGTALTNSNPFPVKVYVNGGALTQIQITIGGTAYTVYSNSTASAVYESFTLPVGASITLTYSTAPTWTWLPEQ